MNEEFERKQQEIFKKYQLEIKDCNKSAIRFDNKTQLTILTFYQNEKVKLKFCFQSFNSAERFRNRLMSC